MAVSGCSACAEYAGDHALLSPASSATASGSLAEITPAVACSMSTALVPTHPRLGATGRGPWTLCCLASTARRTSWPMTWTSDSDAAYAPDRPEDEQPVPQRPGQQPVVPAGEPQPGVHPPVGPAEQPDRLSVRGVVPVHVVLPVLAVGPEHLRTVSRDERERQHERSEHGEDHGRRQWLDQEPANARRQGDAS